MREQPVHKAHRVCRSSRSPQRGTGAVAARQRLYHLNCYVFSAAPGTQFFVGYSRRYSVIHECMDLARISGLLRSLSPRQEKVVRLYFGLGCERPHSAGEMAQEFGVSSHVISGILGGAKRRLALVGLTPTQLKEAAKCEAELRQPLVPQVFAEFKKKCSARNSRS
jgi:hypothetical protein